MSLRSIIIGTRGSKLALWQAHYVKDLINNQFPDVDVSLKIIKTKGDMILDKPLDKIGDRGLFTKELERALIDGEIDICVHSMKDAPVDLAPDTEISAILKREDPRDALVCNAHTKATSLETLPRSSRIGTGSLRRIAQLKTNYPHIEIVPLRGNVDTRIKKSQTDEYDGAILAVSGLKRVGLDSFIDYVIPSNVMIPAVGQGAIGIQARSKDHEVLRICAELHDYETGRCVELERLVLEYLDGGCQVPLGVHAQLKEEVMHVDAIVCALDGSSSVKKSISFPCSFDENLKPHAHRLVDALVDEGADSILRSIIR